MAGRVLEVHGRQYPIPPTGLRIGRGEGNEITLSDNGVSREHARVWVEGSQIMIEDLGSTNGTFVNDYKIDAPCELHLNDTIQIGRATLEIVPPREASGVFQRLSSANPTVVGGVVMLVALVSVVMVGIMLSSGVFDSGDQGATSVPPQTISASDSELLESARLATVLILALDSYGSPFAGGSGGIVDPRGYILTNNHVIEGSSGLLIGLNTRDESKPAIFSYLAEVVFSDPGLDLALLRIVSDENGVPLTSELNLPTLLTGDSDALHIGDEVTILGFPDIGGETLTLTRGAVSGFTQDSLGHTRGWIKTDAELSPGNSGGVAINEEGELIGVPTYVSSEERTLGRLGGLRPIILARSLLELIP